MRMQELRQEICRPTVSPATCTEAVLHHIAAQAGCANAHDSSALACEAVKAFRHAHSVGEPISSLAHASLLYVLDKAAAWELAFCIYEVYPVTVSNCVPKALGEKPWS